ncbi:hypothetical protein KR222_003738, partial [Zaprionus bogoriensis]
VHTMHSSKLLLLLLLTAVVAVSSDSDVATEDADSAAAISTLAPGAQPQIRNLVKRAPTNSFIGMRGKKEQDATSDDHWLGPDPLDYGEDDLDNLYNENGRRLKKAPLAFVGVRGKKYSPGNSHLQALLKDMEEERMRESLLQDLLDHLVSGDNEVAKRAPTGFTGMRGKRPAMNDASEDDDDAMELLEKRAPVNSFVGVRGKKDVSHQHYKRAALSELWRKLFKKAYDVRGKKQRYADFSNKFVAVRGKKSDQEQDYELEQNGVQPWLYLLGGKRAPNGFVGMRGKRPGRC